MHDLTADQISKFREDGFLIVDRLIEPELVSHLRERFADIFAGEFETGIQPDEWNWRPGRDSTELTRQICNGWKSDHTVASVCFREDIGRACARLGGWTGARLGVDNLIWKPSSAKPLGFHQDSSYLSWLDPSDQVSCWIALDQTTAEGGTVLHVRGSHTWGRFAPIRQFHGPHDFMREMEEAARSIGRTPEVVPVVVPPGGGSFHHGWTWHGSGYNKSSSERRSITVHTIQADVEFEPARMKEGIGTIYGRYYKYGDRGLDEYYFPILWSEDGRRSRWIDNYMRAGSASRRHKA